MSAAAGLLGAFALLVPMAAPAAAVTPAPDDLPQQPAVDITRQVVDLTFPVADPDDQVHFSDDFLALRGGGSRLHAATDIMAPKHRPMHAAVGGTITFAPTEEPSYGWMLSIRGDDGRRYSYIHINNDTPERDADGRWRDDDAGGIEHAYAPRIVEAIATDGSARGLRVERGEHIAYVGDSGNAKGIVDHLHLEVEVESSDGPVRINPYHSLVDAIDRGDVPSADGGHLAGRTFLDVDPTSTHGGAIERLTEAGVLTGCGDDRYCPTDAITRGDLAVAVAAATGLPVDNGVSDSRFPDVEVDDDRLAAIVAVDQAEILTGYTDGRFGPDHALTRAQLAAVLVRGFDIPETSRSAGFDDVRPGSTHEAAIDATAAAGLTRGCGDGSNYCGTRDVQRDQIASFLERGIERGTR